MLLEGANVGAKEGARVAGALADALLSLAVTDWRVGCLVGEREGGEGLKSSKPQYLKVLPFPF